MVQVLQSECLIIDRILLTPDGRTLIWRDGGFYICMECKKIKPKHSVKAYSETPYLRIDGEHLCPEKNFEFEEARLEKDKEEIETKKRAKERKRQSSSGDNFDSEKSSHSQRSSKRKRRRLLSPEAEIASTSHAAVSTATLNFDAVLPDDVDASEFPHSSNSGTFGLSNPFVASSLPYQSSTYNNPAKHGPASNTTLEINTFFSASDALEVPHNCNKGFNESQCLGFGTSKSTTPEHSFTPPLQSTVDPLPFPLLPESHFTDNVERNDYPNIDEEFEQQDQKFQPDPALISFNRPSEATLRNACKKLKFQYSPKAYQFWAQIKIEVVKSWSNSIKCGKKYNGFSCIALFLCGSAEEGENLSSKINKKLDSDSLMKDKYTVDQRLQMFVNFHQEEHLMLISNWISAKIGLYDEDGVLHKYGDWNSNAELTILIKRDGNTFAPIYDL